MALTLAANIDLLFTEAGDVPARLHAAADSGFTAVELWTTSDRDTEAILRAASERGVSVTAMSAEPRINIAFPDANLNAYYDGIARTVERAIALECPRVLVSGATGYLRMKRSEQLKRVTEIFAEVIARTEDSGVTFMTENFNIRVDHPGALLDRTRDAVQIARDVGSSRFGVLYDLYHSMTEAEDPATELADGHDVICYLQIADVPGRGEPGSGNVQWPTLLDVIRASGYDGTIGLEFYPTTATETAIHYIQKLVST
ncbi:TIM barrel protein [Paramicrobacterium chengjingii]|uniref:TIM barrel protein n=1 Tax=Paramicrobacterium chengjingii TaxID=2769067 RepID=A0ABX6YHM4_9MICO|nr:TIM barrel protein [Microbacterium chengjingii]QPZ38288.1 TIM barrel protein [Microbacterium chengjingii]